MGALGAAAAAAGAGAMQPSLKTVMDSDATLIPGDFLQSHQLATYQSLGALQGIDLQYTSLDAYPDPIVTAFLTTAPGSGSSTLTSITASLSVGGTVTYNSISLSDGQTYMVQVQATSVSTDSTGIYPDSYQIIKYYSDGTNRVENYSSTLMVVNDSTSPYGAGWSIAGLQQIFGTPGVAGTPVMITDGSSQPELFTTTNGFSYLGNEADLSSLAYSSLLNTYASSTEQRGHCPRIRLMMATTTSPRSSTGTARGVTTIYVQQPARRINDDSPRA